MNKWIWALGCAACLSVTSEALAEDRAPSHVSVGLTINSYGIAFGNARRVHGLRINFIDEGLEEVNGVNLTLWKPGKNPDAQINGLALGLLAPQAHTITGVSIGGLATVSDGDIKGLAVGGLATVSDGNLIGISVGGLAAVANGNITGIEIGGAAMVSNGNTEGIACGGLAVVSNGHLTGVGVGGLAAVANGDITGISVGGLAAVANRNVTGIGIGGAAMVSNGNTEGIACGGLVVVSNGHLTGAGIGGLAVVAEGTMTGLNVGGLAVVAEEGIRGITVGGLGVVSQSELHGLAASAGVIYSRERCTGIAIGGIPSVQKDGRRYAVRGVDAESGRGLLVHGVLVRVHDQLHGMAVGGLHVKAATIRGAAISAGVTRSSDLRGLGVGIVNLVDRSQTGLTIGLFNYAKALTGVQLGVLNYAGNNRGILKLLPVLNARF